MLLPSVLRGLLIATLVSLAVLAILYLRQRQLSTPGYLAWGLLALMAPGLGPFLVIVARPGWRKPPAYPGKHS
jgi:hypothetical protein